MIFERVPLASGMPVMFNLPVTTMAELKIQSPDCDKFPSDEILHISQLLLLIESEEKPGAQFLH